MIEFKGAPDNKVTLLKLQNLEMLTERGMRQGWFAFGDDLKREANREILRTPKGGRVYVRRIRGGRRRRHVASSPGESHANMSGRLRKSLGWIVRGASELEFGYGVDVGRDAPEYAAPIEFGSRRMKPRPSLQNAIRAKIKDAQNNFDRQIGRAMK